MKIETVRNIFGEPMQVVHGSPAVTREFKKQGFTLVHDYTKSLVRGKETWDYNSLQRVWVRKED